MKLRRNAILGALGLALGSGALFATMPAQAQVTYFQQPPSAAELREALMSQQPTQRRTRGIVWSNAAPQGAPPSQAEPVNVRPAPQRPVAAGDSSRPMGSAPAIASVSMQQSAPPAESAGGGGPAAALPITFHIGSSAVSPQSYPYLESVASVLRQDPSLRLIIEGHTDSTGDYRRNVVLSWERALSVLRYFVDQHGIDPQRLQPQGKGPLEPLQGLPPADGMNRRVQFRLAG